MSPGKQIPSLALIHIGLFPSLLPSLHLSFLPFLHPFPPLSSSALTGCNLGWSINRSGTPRQVLGEWWALMTFFFFLSSLSFTLCVPSNYSTWKTLNVSLPETDSLSSQPSRAALSFPIFFPQLSFHRQHSGSSFSLILPALPLWHTLAHPLIRKPNYYHTAPSFCLSAYVKSLSMLWELLNTKTRANN